VTTQGHDPPQQSDPWVHVVAPWGRQLASASPESGSAAASSSELSIPESVAVVEPPGDESLEQADNGASARRTEVKGIGRAMLRSFC
jgi:hypothetical protein